MNNFHDLLVHNRVMIEVHHAKTCRETNSGIALCIVINEEKIVLFFLAIKKREHKSHLLFSFGFSVIS